MYFFLIFNILLKTGFEHFDKNRKFSQNTRLNLAKNIEAVKTFEYEDILLRHQMLEKM